MIVSLNVELYTLRLPELMAISPPLPVVAPLVKVKLIKVTSALVVNILLAPPSNTIAPLSLALIVIALLMFTPLTV